MKIGFINASPKGPSSTTKEIMNRVIPYFKEFDIEDISLETKRELKEECFKANSCAAILIVTPLYLDGLPSSLLQFMSEMEYRHHKNDIPVGVVVHGEFYEGEQAKSALHIVQNWCKKCQMKYIMGIGFGGNGTNLPEKTTRNLQGALAVNAMGLKGRSSKEDQYLHIQTPKLFYKSSMDSKWKKEIKENGLATRDLEAKPTE